MALTNCYCTLAELQARMGVGDTIDDVTLEQVITGVSRMIDDYTRRRFYVVTPETRYYTPRHTDVVETDDMIAVTTVATDADGDRTYETTWAATDYGLCPINAAVDGHPYTAIEIAPQGRYTFPMVRRGLKIVGSFGYAATAPDVVREACLLQAARVFKRKDAPFGIAGVPELGMLRISQLDPDVKMLLNGVRAYNR